MKRAALGSLLILCLLLAACTQGQIIGTLTGVLTAIELVLPSIEKAAGVPAATINQVEGYLSAVNDAAGQAADIWAGPGTAAMKAARITALFAGIVEPKLPPGTPRTILDAIAQVAKAVLKFLGNFSSPGFAANNTTQKIEAPSAVDKEKLRAIQSRSLALQAQIGALRK